MIKLVFVRHGETENNKKGILQGHLDSPLNENGIKDAEDLASNLKKINFDVIISSNLLRAQQCSEQIAKYFPHLSIIKEPLLKEKFFGEHQGKVLVDLGFKNNIYPEMVRHLYECNCEGGETNEQLTQRIKVFLDNLIEKHNNKKILIVTHGGVIMLALNHLFHEEIKYKNAREHKNGYCSFLYLDDNKNVIDSKINVPCSVIPDFLIQ